MKAHRLLWLFCFASPALQAGTLNTPSFTVTVESHCQEGEVACDKVSYRGISKKTGNALSLKGKTLHTRCQDGSPCRFLGYEFRSGKIVYRVFDEGRLEVTQSGRVLVDEAGEWTW